MKSIRVVRLHTAPSSPQPGYSFEAMVSQAPLPAESPNLEVISKYELPHWNISSRVLSYIDLATWRLRRVFTV